MGSNFWAPLSIELRIQGFLNSWFNVLNNGEIDALLKMTKKPFYKDRLVTEKMKAYIEKYPRVGPKFEILEKFYLSISPEFDAVFSEIKSDIDG